MNEWRGALGAYVQKLGEYDLLSEDDEKEPALRAELLATVLKSGTVSSRGAWGDKDWSQPQWLVLAPSRALAVQLATATWDRGWKATCDLLCTICREEKHKCVR